jgi:hypothetical protein
MTTAKRCPTAREDTEIRVLTVAGATAHGRDIVIQTYRRIGNDIAAPWGPTAAAVRLPARYAERLIELIAELTAEVTATAERGGGPVSRTRHRRQESYRCGARRPFARRRSERLTRSP